MKKINKKTTLILLDIALVLILITIALSVITGMKKSTDEKINTQGNQIGNTVPTPEMLKFGLRLENEVLCDLNGYMNDLKCDVRFSGYSINHDYKLIFQAKDKDSVSRYKEKLGISSKLPEIDFEQRYMLISLGHKLVGLTQENSKTDYVTSEKVPNIIYYNDEYKANTAYIYSMNKVDFLEGYSLEEYYWRTLSPECNLVLNEDIPRTLLSEGKYSKTYRVGDSSYEYVIYNTDKEPINRNVLQNTPPEINELNNQLVEIALSDNRQYYVNPIESKISEIYEMPTHFLYRDIITYMRRHNDEIQYILRNAYDDSAYAKIVRLDFPTSQPDTELDKLVLNADVVDKYHIRVTYLKGAEKVETTEIVEVYYLDRGQLTTDVSD